MAEWAFPAGIDLTAIEGDVRIADGVRIISTPGHTPGHQSVLIEDGNGTRTIVCCQASWNTQSFEAGTLGDDGWNQDEGIRSLEKLRALDPDRVVLSHDIAEWCSSHYSERLADVDQERNDFTHLLDGDNTDIAE